METSKIHLILIRERLMDRQTDGETDEATDGRTDGPIKKWLIKLRRTLLS